MKISDELKQKLIDEAEMTNTQASSAAVEKLLAWLTPEKLQAVMDNAEHVFKQMRDETWRELSRARRENEKAERARMSTEKALTEFSNAFLEASKAEDEYGYVSDERGKNAIALYGHLIKMGGDSEQALKNAGYTGLGSIYRFDYLTRDGSRRMHPRQPVIR